jgi:hypothetical protein
MNKLGDGNSNYDGLNDYVTKVCKIEALKKNQDNKILQGAMGLELTIFPFGKF